jgi:hypothetical protein
MKMTSDMEIKALVDNGAEIVDRLKKLLLPDTKWNVSICMDLAEKLTSIKHLARTYYPNEEDYAVLGHVMRYNNVDLLEILEEATKNGQFKIKSIGGINLNWANP